MFPAIFVFPTMLLRTFPNTGVVRSEEGAPASALVSKLLPACGLVILCGQPCGQHLEFSGFPTL